MLFIVQILLYYDIVALSVCTYQILLGVWIRWNGMVEWNGLDWTGLEWNGMIRLFVGGIDLCPCDIAILSHWRSHRYYRLRI